MSNGSQTQGQSNNMQGTEYYSLKNLEEFSQDLRRRHRVDNHLVRSVLRAGSILSELEEKTPRPNDLSKQDLFEKEFRTTTSFNMSILDLHTHLRADHEIMAGLLERRLRPNVKHTLHGGIRPEGKVWVIHMFCYNISVERLTPLTLSFILLESILAQLSTKPSTRNQDWGFFEVTHERARKENSRMPDYQKTMEVLQALIYRILKRCPENTIHFVFTGIKRMKLDHWQLQELACFVIDMARLVKTALPIQGDRMMKCIFCGDGLLDFSYLFDYLEQHKQRLEAGSEEVQEEIKDIFEKMLMLDWNWSQSCWIEQDLVSHFIDPNKAKKRRDHRSQKLSPR